MILQAARLRQKLVEKRAGTLEQDKLDKKRNEEIRRKSTKETQDVKEELKKKEQLKEGASPIENDEDSANRLKLPRRGKKSKKTSRPNRG